MRPNDRSLDALRDVSLTSGVAKYAEGSCLAKFGDTHVLCTASVDENVPRWMKGSGKGWVTAEYGMLPRSTHSRNNREAARGKHCLLYTSPSPRDQRGSRMPSSA